MGSQNTIISAIDAGADIYALAQEAAGDDYKLAFFPKNDMGNAMRMLSRFGQKMMYVRDVGWHVYDGKKWDEEGGPKQVQLFAQRTSSAIKREADAVMDGFMADLHKVLAKDFAAQLPAVEKILAENIATAALKKIAQLLSNGLVSDSDKWLAANFPALPLWMLDYAKAHRSYGVKVGNSAPISNMLREAMPHIMVAVEDLDGDDYLFNVQNGTLKLDRKKGTWSLQRHNPADLITRISKVEYNKKAKAPIWAAFIETIFPNETLRPYMQARAGYGITGSAEEQDMQLDYGSGANGKSVMHMVQKFVMGSYAVTVQFETLSYDPRKSSSGPSPEVTRLRGPRMVFSEEPEVGTKLSEGFVKQITGQASIVARNHHQAPFEFIPKFKVRVAFNNKPTVRGQDEGIWRRLKMTPFEAYIPPKDRDKKLTAKLQAEGSGILNWMLDGFKIWAVDGIDEPEVVTTATNEYREEMNPLGSFADHCLAWEEGARARAQDIRLLYEKWCQLNDVQPLSGNLFGRKLSETPLKGKQMHAPKKIGGMMCRENIRLLYPTVAHLEEYYADRQASDEHQKRTDGADHGFDGDDLGAGFPDDGGENEL